MNQRGMLRLRTICGCFMVGFCVLAHSVWSRSLADDEKESAKLGEDRDDVFRLDGAWRLDIAISPDEYAAMQPIVRAGFPGAQGGPPPKAEAKRDTNRASERNLMG